MAQLEPPPRREARRAMKAVINMVVLGYEEEERKPSDAVAVPTSERSPTKWPVAGDWQLAQRPLSFPGKPEC